MIHRCFQSGRSLLLANSSSPSIAMGATSSAASVDLSASSMSDALAPHAPTGSCGCFLMQHVMVESPGRQSAGPRTAVPAEQPDARTHQSRARFTNTAEVKCFTWSRLEQSHFETLRRARSQGDGRSRPLSARLTRDISPKNARPSLGICFCRKVPRSK